MPDFQRWEVVEYSLPTPADQIVLAKMFEAAGTEIGEERMRYHEAIKVLVRDDEIVLRFLKPRDQGTSRSP